MRVRFYDPAGSPGSRAGAALVAGILALVSVALVPFASGSPIGALFLGVAATHLYTLLASRRGARVTEMKVQPGRLHFPELPHAPIVGRELVGAAVSSGDGGERIAIARRGRLGMPVVMTFERAEDAREARRALGIGARGFGAVQWWTGRRLVDWTSILARVVATCAWAVSGLFTLTQSSANVGDAGADFSLFTSSPLFAIAIAATSIAALLALFARGRGPSLALTPDAVVASRLGLRATFEELAGAEAVRGGVQLKFADETRAPVMVPLHETTRLSRGMTAQEARAVASMVRASIARASTRDVPRAQADMLVRSDEPARSWLARLDAAARSLAGGGAYRRAQLDEEELWSTLDDADAHPDARAGAARILTRIAPDAAGPRVDAALASMRDKATIRHVRLALHDDAEEAAARLDREAQRR